MTVKVLLPVTVPEGTVHHDAALDSADHVILEVTPTFTEPEPAEAVPELAPSVSAAAFPLWVRL